LTDGTALEYRATTYHTFGNNGSVALNGNINDPSSTALPGLANRTTVLNLLTTVTDHLPTVADFTVAGGTTSTTTTLTDNRPNPVPRGPVRGLHRHRGRRRHAERDGHPRRRRQRQCGRRLRHPQRRFGEPNRVHADRRHPPPLRGLRRRRGPQRQPVLPGR